MWAKLLLLPILFLLAVGEGSRDLYTDDLAVCTEYDLGGSCRANLEWTNVSVGGYYRRTLFAVYAYAGEVILMGSSSMNVSGGDIVLYRPGMITGENGNENIPDSPTWSCKEKQANRGRITSRLQEKTGPTDVNNPSALPNGYNPCFYQVTIPGIHHVAFFGPRGQQATPDGSVVTGEANLASAQNFGPAQGATIAAWDVTVRPSINGLANIDGRVFTYLLSLTTTKNERPVFITLHPVTVDGYRYRYSTAGMDANHFAIYGSSYGFADASTPLYHDVRGTSSTFSSVVNDVFFAFPNIPHFIQPPSEESLVGLGYQLTPTVPILVDFKLLTIEITGGSISINSNMAAIYSITIGQFVDPLHPRNRVLRGLALPGWNTVEWDGRDNEGVIFPAGGPYQMLTSLHAGEYHAILLDVESNLGGGPQIELVENVCPPLAGGCFGAFFDDRGYRLSNGAIVGRVEGELCPLTGSAPGPGRSDPIVGFDTRTKLRAFGVSSGVNKTGIDCTSTNSFGDAKALDVWTYTSTNSSKSVLFFKGGPVSPDTIFVSTWETTTINENITLPLRLDDYVLNVDWGDGSPKEIVLNPPVSHRYAVPGIYSINIIGSLPGFQFRSQGDAAKLISIESWGGFTLDGSSGETFAGCFNLRNITATDQPHVLPGAVLKDFFLRCSTLAPVSLAWDLSNATSLRGMFSSALAFNARLTFQLRDVRDIAYMFSNTPSFDQPVQFDSVNVTDMSFMFFRATAFNSPVILDTKNVKSMQSMFRDAISFNKPLFFETSSCETMAYMFRGALSFNQAISFDTRSALNLAGMFFRARSFNSPVAISSSNTPNMSQMFREAENFNQPCDFRTIMAQDMSEMFFGASAFNQPLSFDTSQVTTMASMFENAISYNQTIRFITTSALNMSRMFRNARAFVNQPLNFDTSSVIDMSEMFANVSTTMAYDFWQATQVTFCSGFCEFCGLPAFSLCEACLPRVDSGAGYEVCNCPPGRSVAFNTTSCVSVPCFIERGYIGRPGGCHCAYGYAGKVKYLGNLTTGCEKVRCSLEEGTIGTPGNCTCAEGTFGSVIYLDNFTTAGCVGVQCPAPAFVGSPGECICAVGFTGVISYSGSNVVGCTRNDTTVVVPFTNTSKETVVNAKGGVQVVIPPDPLYGDRGTVVVTTSNDTASENTVSTVVTIVVLDPSNNPRSIKNLTTPFRFTIPLNPGASDPVSMCEGAKPVSALPECRWFDTVDRVWTTAGCTTANLTTAMVECSCVHMTDFALVLPNYNRVPIQQFLDLTPSNVRRYPDGIMTVSLVLALFALLLIISAIRDTAERHEAKNLSKWSEELAASYDVKANLWQRFTLGLQVYHTWAALLCRKGGTSFRSVDRVFVTLMMVLTLMGMSANFHRRDQTYLGRTVVVASSVLASLVPSQLLAFLFRHTGEMGYLEKWELDMGLQQPSRFRCLQHRFEARWKWVWYGIVLLCATMLILYILSIALMFDQNPWYYCRGQTTQAWIIDFLLQYTLTVFLVEPFKIFIIVLVKSCLKPGVPKKRLSGSLMLEPTYYEPLEKSP